MRKINVNKGLIIVVTILLIGASLIPVSFIGSAKNSTIKDQEATYTVNEGTEYWALLVAVAEYADAPGQNRPLMLEEVDDLYELLLQSDIWSEDHIKVIKAEDATVSNILSGLRWLDDMEDEDDISLVYLTTHGYPLGFDIPPFDEEDGTDEALVSYWGFAYNLGFIWDDELNVMLNRLESQGVCLIVDSCYAGGFNDPPDWLNKNIFNSRTTENKQSAKEWIEGFGEEVSGQNRVVIMASCEDELSYSGGFAPYLIDGIRGFADSDSDDVVTAEEAFYYAEPRTYRQNPTIFDGYPGELPIFYIENPKENTNNHNDVSTEKKNIASTSNVQYLEENSVINGYVEEAGTNDPIEDATVYIRGRDTEWEFFENETTTDLNGFYSFNVPPGYGRITVYADGYCSAESGYLEIGENDELWVNFSMYPRPPENSIVCGYITDDDTSDPIAGANITLYWEGDQNQFYINDTISDIDGYYQMNVAAGELYLDVEASGYFSEDIENILISDYETLWINFSLISRPPENSVICGYITDKDTGDPIANARIEFEWIDVELDHAYYNETNSDSSGFYSINIAVGEIYHDIRGHGYDYYNPYRLDVEEYKTQWMNISLEEQTIEVEIAKPLRAFYIGNNRLFPYNKVRIIGSIDIEAYAYEDWWGPGGDVDKIEFYIDGDLKATINEEPFTWSWTDRTFGKHTIKVIAYDDEGNSDSKEIEVYKLL